MIWAQAMAHTPQQATVITAAVERREARRDRALLQCVSTGHGVSPENAVAAYNELDDVLSRAARCR